MRSEANRLWNERVYGELRDYAQSLEEENYRLTMDKLILDWLEENTEAIMWKFKPDDFRLAVRESVKLQMERFKSEHENPKSL